MLTIMISDANPGISPPAPPHEETGYYQPPTGSNILSRTANQRGDRGSLPKGHVGTQKHQEENRKGEMEVAPGGEDAGMQCVVSHKGREC